MSHFEHSAEVFEVAPTYTIDTAPLAVIGGPAGEPGYEIGTAETVVVLSDGRVATLSALGSKLFIFGADGRAQRRLGRVGRGPGEMIYAMGLVALAGDTLLVPDGATRRINRFHPDLGYVSSTSLPGRETRDIGQTAGVLPDKRLVMYSGNVGRRAVPNKVIRDSFPVVVIDPQRKTARQITRIPNTAMTLVRDQSEGQTSWSGYAVAVRGCQLCSRLGYIDRDRNR